MNRLLTMTFALLLCLGHSVRALDGAQTEATTAKAERKRNAATRRARTPNYLETGGQRKLDVLYKKTPERDLQLDLYYPTGNRSSQCPVIIYTHGGGARGAGRDTDHQECRA